MNRRRRLALVPLLVVLAVLLCVHYGGVYEQHWPHPTGDQLAEDPDGWDGDDVLLFGTVTERTDGGFVVEVVRDSGEIARVVTVQGSERTVGPGAVVQVYGELSERGTVQRADTVVVVNDSASAGQYKLAVSVLGVLVAAGAFLWYWGIDWRRFQFYNRHTRGDSDG